MERSGALEQDPRHRFLRYHPGHPHFRCFGTISTDAMKAGRSSSADALAELITEAALRRLAGERSYARGLAYFESGAVIDLVRTDAAIKARVAGSDDYRVRLRAAGHEIDWSCTCPLGDEGTFCKHAVAAGVAWLHAGGKAFDELAALRSHLAAKSKEALIELLLEQASEDPELRALLASASLRETGNADLEALKDALRRAFAVRGFIDYRDMRALLARAEPASALLRDLIASGRAAEALELADYAMRQGLSAYERIDDSAGGFGELLRKIAELHLEACRQTAPCW